MHPCSDVSKPRPAEDDMSEFFLKSDHHDVESMHCQPWLEVYDSTRTYMLLGALGEGPSILIHSA